MVEAFVEYDYVAQESDELTIKKGDIISNVTVKPGGWWEGVLNEKKGVFPDNFVKVVDKVSTVTYRNKKDSTPIQQCKVVFNYKQSHEDELTLCVGDVIDIIGEAEEGWWKGTLNGKEGLFPSNFVEEIPPTKYKSKHNSREDLTNSHENDANIPVLPPKAAKILCEVKFAYTAQNDDELTLKEGDIITLVSKDGQDPGWWTGELNGKIGVFPDNFVVIVSSLIDKSPKDDKKPVKLLNEISPIKPSAIVSQRKSLEVKPDTDNRVTPPIPGKKPSVPIKKSPTGSSSGIFAGLRKKLVDVVDGSASSKAVPTGRFEFKFENKPDDVNNAFDHVERNSLLQDVRATRAKPPGRRPPSVVFKEAEPGILNGNTEHTSLETVSETTNFDVEQETAEIKPKVREWEKRKAPWLEEMKLNQAKRTSPGPEQNKFKLTPTDKSLSSELDEMKISKSTHFEKDPSPVDMSKSMPSLSSKLKTPPDELEKDLNSSVMIRNKTPVQPSVRPQTIQNIISTNSADTTKIVNAASPIFTKLSPHVIQNIRTPSPQKPTVNEQIDFKAGGDSTNDNNKNYDELLQRINNLEILIKKQSQTYEAAIEDLRCKLQKETDMRILLEIQVDKLFPCAMQL